MKSLRSKVFVCVLCGLVLVTMAAEWLLYRQAVAFAEKELFDSLRKYAVALSDVSYIDSNDQLTLHHDWESRLKISPDDRAQFFEFKSAEGHYLIDSHNLGGDSLPEVGGHQEQKLVDYGNIVLGVYEYHFERGVEAQPRQYFKLVVAQNTNLIKSARSSTIKTLLLFTPLALIAAFVISFGLTAITLSSISRFTKRVQSFSRNDNRSKLSLDSIDKEIKPLGEALNKYIYQLNKHASLESKLLADTAHELRTPLAKMREELDQLMQATPVTDGAAINIDAIDRDLSALQRMTDNMLMLYRIESGNYHPRMELFDLNTEIQRITPNLQKATQLAIKVLGQDIEIYSNRTVLNLIVSQLVGNVSQHASVSSVQISFEAVADGVLLHVDDAGPGIADTERERIFERHYSFEGGNQASSVGSGLGLTLVKLYASSISAQASCVESPLGGARFTVHFASEKLVDSLRQHTH